MKNLRLKIAALLALLVVCFQNCSNQGSLNLGSENPPGGGGTLNFQCNFGATQTFYEANTPINVQYSAPQNLALDVRVYDSSSNEVYRRTLFNSGILPGLTLSNPGAYRITGIFTPQGQSTQYCNFDITVNSPTAAQCQLNLTGSNSVLVGESRIFKITSSPAGKTAKLKIEKQPSASSSNNLALTTLSGTTTVDLSTTVSKTHTFSANDLGTYRATGYIVHNGQDLACSPLVDVNLVPPAATQASIEFSQPLCSVTTNGSTCNNTFTYNVQNLATNKRVVFYKIFGTAITYLSSIGEVAVNGSQTSQVAITNTDDTKIRAYEKTSGTSFTPSLSSPFLAEAVARASFSSGTNVSATLVPTPAQCQIPAGSTTCSVTIQNTITNRPTNTYIAIWAKNSSGQYASNYTDCRPSSSFTTQNINWITASGYNFEAYVAGTTQSSCNTRTGNPIGSVFVRGELSDNPNLTLSHSTTECTGSCTITTQHTVSYLPSGKVIRLIHKNINTGAEASLKCLSSTGTGSVSKSFSYANNPGTNIYRAYLVDTCTSSYTGLNAFYESESILIRSTGGGGSCITGVCDPL